MNGFDMVLGAVLIVSVTIGAWRGFVREFLALLTWVVGVAVAWWSAGMVSEHLENVVSDSGLRHALAFAIVFVAVFLLGTAAALLINRFVLANRSFRMPNTILGALVGAARGVAIIVIAFMVAGLTPLPQRSWWREATLVPYFERLAQAASDYIPRDVARNIRYS
jgi:membrane protein required for colicin V production